MCAFKIDEGVWQEARYEGFFQKDNLDKSIEKEFFKQASNKYKTLPKN